MLEIDKRIIGWYDSKLHVVYTAGEAEAKFGSRLYCDRSSYLRPIYEPEHEAPKEEDAWVTNFKRWDAHNPEVPVLRSRFMERIKH